MSLGTDWLVGASITACPSAATTAATSLTITGVVRDGAGSPVSDAMIEFWQADPKGRFPPETPEGWRGFARVLTDDAGRYTLFTVKPGRVTAGDDTLQAPHVDVSVFARGLMQRLVTRIYFAPDSEALETDPVLASVPEQDRSTLVASPGERPGELCFDIWLQGGKETVFFAPF